MASSGWIEIDVVGVPFPQGSKSAYVRGGRAVVTEGSSVTGRAGHAAWRQAVATATRDWLTEHPRLTINEPIEISMEFRFPMVRSDPYRTRHQTKPDLSKLVRATEDALVDGGLIKDDSCVFAMWATKRYATTGPPGCTIAIGLHGEAETSDRAAMKLSQRKARR